MKLSALQPMAEAFGPRTATRPGAERSGESAQAKRLQEMKQGLAQLASLPGPKDIARQATAVRVGMLQRRVDEMKKFLMYATPQQARALARELKEMARELAAAARALGGRSGGGGVGATAAPAGDAERMAAQRASAAAQQAAAHSGQAGAAQDAAHAGENALADAPTDAPTDARTRAQAGAGGHDSAARPPASDDSGLRAAIGDTRRKLKEALALVKMQLAKGDREGRRDLADAQRALRAVDDALRQGGGWPAGADAAADASLAGSGALAAVGSLIDVSA